MFEPIGGSAPKYTGRNVINPIAAIAAVAMLLRETGTNSGDAKLVEAGNRVENAIMALTPKMLGHPLHAVEGRACVLFVYQAHPLQVQGALAACRVVIARPRQAHENTLALD